MKEQRKISEEVSKTLSLLDNLPVVEENPFFFTRIKERLDTHNYNNKSESNKIINFLKPVFIAVLFFVNIYTVIIMLSNTNNSTSREQYVSSVVSDYSPSYNNDYLSNINSSD